MSMADFEEEDKITFVYGLSGAPLHLGRRPSTVCEAAALALAAVRKIRPLASKVVLVHGNKLLRNGYPVVGDAEIQVIVVEKIL